MQYRIPKRFILFTLVGGSGILVNMLALYLMKQHGQITLALASPIAIQLAIFNNYIWNRQITWTDRKIAGLKGIRNSLIRFTMVSWIAGTVNWVLLLLLTHISHIHYLLANLMAILIASVLNYFLNDLWTFRKPGDYSESFKP